MECSRWFLSIPKLVLSSVAPVPTILKGVTAIKFRTSQPICFKKIGLLKRSFLSQINTFRNEMLSLYCFQSIKKGSSYYHILFYLHFAKHLNLLGIGFVLRCFFALKTASYIRCQHIIHIPLKGNNTKTSFLSEMLYSYLCKKYFLFRHALYCAFSNVDV